MSLPDIFHWSVGFLIPRVRTPRMPTRPSRRGADRDLEEGRSPPRRSHAAAYAALAVLFVGVSLGTFTILIPALLGFGLLVTGWSFLSTRLNPFAIGFYLTTKPSWTAIAVVFLAAVLLLYAAYAFFVHGIAPVFPGTVHHLH